MSTETPTDDAVHATAVAKARRDLAECVQAAGIYLDGARAAVQFLRSDAVFDVEYAEGDTGRDVMHWLEQAARALRAVEAINGTVAPNT